MNSFLQGKSYRALTTALIALVIALLIFWAGTAVGSREGRFAGQWNANYERQFGGPGSPLGSGGDRDSGPMNAHGAFGEIVGVRLPQLVVKGPSEDEKTVTVGAHTVIRRFHDDATTTDLIPGETVVVIGEPDSQGDIQASLIRIVPPMPMATGTAQTAPATPAAPASL